MSDENSSSPGATAGEADQSQPSWWSTTAYSTRSKICYGAAVIFFSVGFALMIGQLFAFERIAARRKESFVVFTDGDVDDLLALHMLFRRADVEVPLVVVSGNGIASPRAAFTNVRRFVALCQKQRKPHTLEDSGGGQTAVGTKVLMGSMLAQKDQSAPSSSTCSYSRFARSSSAIRIGADTLYGQAEALKSLAQGAPSNNATAVSGTTQQQQQLVDAFASAVVSAGQFGTKTTLLVLGPATDAALLLRALPDKNAAHYFIRLVVMAGGKFGGSASTTGGVPDALMSMRDHRSRSSSSSKSEVGQDAELNFFLDPEAANDIITGAVYASLPTKSSGGDDVVSTVAVPTVVVPVDVSGSNAAYIDYHDQWAKLLATKGDSKSDPVGAFLAKTLQSYSDFEGKIFFPFKATPKSVAAVAVALDRVVRNTLYTYIVDESSSSSKRPGVLTYDSAATLGAAASVGRSGEFVASSSSGGGSYAGVVEIPMGFADGGTSRVFLDSYLRSVALPWP